MVDRAIHEEDAEEIRSESEENRDHGKENPRLLPLEQETGRKIEDQEESHREDHGPRFREQIDRKDRNGKKEQAFPIQFSFSAEGKGKEKHDQGSWGVGGRKSQGVAVLQEGAGDVVVLGVDSQDKGENHRQNQREIADPKGPSHAFAVAELVDACGDKDAIGDSGLSQDKEQDGEDIEEGEGEIGLPAGARSIEGKEGENHQDPQIEDKTSWEETEEGIDELEDHGKGEDKGSKSRPPRGFDSDEDGLVLGKNRLKRGHFLSSFLERRLKRERTLFPTRRTLLTTRLSRNKRTEMP